MWERFGFYTMLAMFTLYLQHKDQGFGWTEEKATSLYSYYMMFVYASPLVGGWIADRRLGYWKSVLLGGFIFMLGYFLLAVHSLPVLYLGLTCLVIGNGFFKPNVSAMVGHLYPEGSPLKDRAYNIFYMGINIGALLAPLSAGLMVKYFGFHPAFAVAGFGMIISVSILWNFKYLVETKIKHAPAEISQNPIIQRRKNAIDEIPDNYRIGALLIIFLIVIVFWMVFHQNGSTLTYWAKDNTDWSITRIISNDDKEVLGIISNVINPFWVVTLTFPVVWFWKGLARYGMEPSTPTKMAMGMFLLGLSFFIMYAAAKTGEQELSQESRYQFRVSILWLIATYFVATLGELMLSPMGLSLVSKVSPVRFRGIMMGGWFVATAIGNKLTAIGIYWKEWWHSSFFAILGGMALFMAVILFLLLKPLKKAMPGV
jgi:POT family proton-dependent oligopeptide transporter